MRLGFLVFVPPLLLGCGDDDGSIDSSVDADAGPAALPLDTVPSGEIGDIPTEPRPDTCDFRGGSGSTAPDACSGETSAWFFVSRFEFTEAEIVDGVRRLVGFDLDGVHSEGGRDESGCGVRDGVSLDGVYGGVDNEGASLVPSVDMILTSDLRTTAETAIAEGRFGVLVELRHWNGTGDDDCVDVVVHEAFPVTTLELDASGAPIAGQSFALQNEPRAFVGETLVANELRADLGGFPVPQPFMMDLQSAHLRLQWDGTRFIGVVAGELPADTVAASLACREERLPADVLMDLTRDLSDLRPDTDGECRGISWAFRIATVDSRIADI